VVLLHFTWVHRDMALKTGLFLLLSVLTLLPATAEAGRRRCCSSSATSACGAEGGAGGVAVAGGACGTAGAYGADGSMAGIAGGAGYGCDPNWVEVEQVVMVPQTVTELQTVTVTELQAQQQQRTVTYVENVAETTQVT